MFLQSKTKLVVADLPAVQSLFWLPLLMSIYKSVYPKYLNWSSSSCGYLYICADALVNYMKILDSGETWRDYGMEGDIPHQAKINVKNSCDYVKSFDSADRKWNAFGSFRSTMEYIKRLPASFRTLTKDWHANQCTKVSFGLRQSEFECWVEKGICDLSPMPSTANWREARFSASFWLCQVGLLLRRYQWVPFGCLFCEIVFVRLSMFSSTGLILQKKYCAFSSDCFESHHFFWVFKFVVVECVVLSRRWRVRRWWRHTGLRRRTFELRLAQTERKFAKEKYYKFKYYFTRKVYQIGESRWNTTELLIKPFSFIRNRNSMANRPSR